MSDLVSRAHDIARHALRPDLRGTVIEGERISLVRWVIEAGRPATKLHAHDIHEQFTIVLSGEIETVIGDQRLRLAPGDICRIRSGIIHGETIALGNANAVLIDVFEPARDDYVSPAREQDAAA